MALNIEIRDYSKKEFTKTKYIGKASSEKFHLFIAAKLVPAEKIAAK